MLDSLAEKVNWRVRNWERQRRHTWLTAGWTRARQLFHNRRDRGKINRLPKFLDENVFPRDVESAVHAICEGEQGEGIRPMQLEPELNSLISLIRDRKPTTVLEIGTARGGTLCLLCRFAAPEATIVSVDLPYGRNGGGYPRWKEAYYHLFPLPEQTLHLIRANSHATETVAKVAQAIGGRSFDFILIDADHSYEGVKTDFRLYAPLIAKNGLIALHDVLPNIGDPSIDVNRFWDELTSKPDQKTSTLTSYADQKAFGIGLVYP
ncbi:MAG: class I SAM-dependent methyltransferase [Rhodobacteraceae bacterium]|nr:MAG: class I SAM-dependent methyltransferase [Paracoccaceae bacterium]